MEGPRALSPGWARPPKARPICGAEPPPQSYTPLSLTEALLSPVARGRGPPNQGKASNSSSLLPFPGEEGTLPSPALTPSIPIHALESQAVSASWPDCPHPSLPSGTWGYAGGPQALPAYGHQGEGCSQVGQERAPLASGAGQSPRLASWSLSLAVHFPAGSATSPSLGPSERA